VKASFCKPMQIDTSSAINIFLEIKLVGGSCADKFETHCRSSRTGYYIPKLFDNFLSIRIINQHYSLGRVPRGIDRPSKRTVPIFRQYLPSWRAAMLHSIVGVHIVEGCEWLGLRFLWSCCRYRLALLPLVGKQTLERLNIL
jgi:hypothetical protein